MQKFILLSTTLLALFITAHSAFSQKPLTGNGKILALEIPPLTAVNAIEIQHLSNAKVEIVVGDSLAVSVSADENLADLIEIAQKKQQLSITIPTNRGNRLWMEDTHIQIRIQVPELEALDIDGGMYTEVRNLSGSVRLEKSGNGNIVLSGNGTGITIHKAGNGDVNAGKFLVQQAKVQSMGNGNVVVNASETLRVNRSGNGDVINEGAGTTDQGISIGNGEVIDREEAAQKAALPAPKYIKVTLTNPDFKRRHYTVRGGAGKSFSYGISIGPKGQLEENFPVGTRIENALGRTIYTIVEADERKKVKL